jgi:hypothetical protein
MSYPYDDDVEDGGSMMRDSWAAQQLREAAMRNDTDRVAAILDESGSALNVNQADLSHRRTALHFAVSVGAVSIGMHMCGAVGYEVQIQLAWSEGLIDWWRFVSSTNVDRQESRSQPGGLQRKHSIAYVCNVPPASGVLGSDVGGGGSGGGDSNDRTLVDRALVDVQCLDQLEYRNRSHTVASGNRS